MKATYVGDTTLPKHEQLIPEEMQAFGLTFERGKATDIPDDLPAHQQAKLVGNPHFKVTGVKAGDE